MQALPREPGAATAVRRNRAKKTPLRVGDRVVRNKAVGATPATPAHRGDLVGTVLKLTHVTSGAGGTRARVRVRWDTGHEASVEDRQLLLESRAKKA